MHVVHHAQQRLLFRRLHHQAQRGHGHQELVRLASIGKPERDTQASPLWLGQRAQLAGQRSAQLVKPGKRELHFGLDAEAPHDLKAGRLLSQLAQQSRLAGTRLAAHDHYAALSFLSAVHKAPQERHLGCPPVYALAIAS